MAKSARASVLKRNRSAFRKNISGPREQARAERLNAKLAELVAQPKPGQDEKTEVQAETSGTNAHDALKKPSDDVMDTDGNQDGAVAAESKGRSKKTSTRIQKNRRQKPRNQMTFKSLDRKKQARKGKK